MLRSALLLLAASGCGLYITDDGSGGDSPGDDAPDDDAPDDDEVPLEPPIPLEPCTPVATTLTPPSDPSDPAFGCTIPPVSADQWIVFDSDRDLFNRDLYVMRASGTDVCRLTTGTSVDKEPAPSFDGTKIAFASNRSGNFQIHLIDFQTNTVRRLTTLGGEEPAFSHDGSLIAFRRRTAIYTIGVDGTDERKIADSGLDLFNAYANPQFSIDDTELYFDRNNELDAIHLDGSGFRYIVNNWTTFIKAPGVVSNGLAVAYEVGCDGLSIWITSTQTASNPCTGRRATPIDPDRPAHRPAVGPTNIMAFEREGGSGTASIVLVDTAPNSQLCPITSEPYDHRNPAWLLRPEP